MSTQPKRATVYFDPELHKALRLRAADGDRALSDLVNEAIRAYLSDDFEDLAALRERGNEESRPFEDFIGELKAKGRI